MTRTMSLLRVAAVAGVAIGVVAAGFGVVHASDPTALYARVDKVILEPNPDKPQAIQVWGVFSMAKPDDRNDYLPAARGYLYFKLPGAAAVGTYASANEDTARKEWADLKAVAGTGQLVSFGSRLHLTARLRKSDETPASPDPYTTNFGVTKITGRTDYAPVRALLDFKD